MPLGTENVQAADSGDFVVFFVGLLFVAVEGFGPLVGRNNVFVPVVVKYRGLAVFLWAFNLALRNPNSLRDSLLHQLLLGHEFWIAAKQNVGAAPRHIGRDRDHTVTSSLRHNFGLALMELGVQDYVLV